MGCSYRPAGHQGEGTGKGFEPLRCLPGSLVGEECGFAADGFDQPFASYSDGGRLLRLDLRRNRTQVGYVEGFFPLSRASVDCIRCCYLCVLPGSLIKHAKGSVFAFVGHVFTFLGWHLAALVRASQDAALPINDSRHNGRE